MMAKAAECGVAEARTRLRTASAYLEVAELVLDERDAAEYRSVGAGVAVLAGIAASDAVCCRRLGRRHRGGDHRGAAELLRQATPDSARMASTLLRLLDLKGEAHYGVANLSLRKARDASVWARRLVEAAWAVVEA